VDIVAAVIAVAVMVIVIGVVITILRVVWHATGNLIDWVILTFGNQEAVKDLKRRRGWD
jgi:hypothetical protein